MTDDGRLQEEDIIEQRRAKRQRLLEELENNNNINDDDPQDDRETPVVTSNGNSEKDPLTQQEAKVESGPIVTKTTKTLYDSDSEDDMFADESSDHDVKGSEKKDAKVGKELAATLLDNWDDVQGYYRAIPGELFNGRYLVKEVLGKGMFASVVRADDSKNEGSGQVAIKIIRNNESMAKAAQKEINILRSLNKKGPFIVQLLTTFTHKGHLCLVFENLQANVRDVLKKFGRAEGLNMESIRTYSRQLLKGLNQLRQCHIVHADLKPDNILVTSAHTLVKVADLGSAQELTDEDELISGEPAPYMASRFYRAPELILGLMPYGYGVDMWSLGCTLYEMYTGQLLFAGQSNNNMLKVIMDVRGKFSHKLLRRAELTKDHFTNELDFLERVKDRVTGNSTLKVVKIPLTPPAPLRTKLQEFGRKVKENRTDLDQFIDLLDRMLALNPDKRITPADALKHPFITGSYAQDRYDETK